jgi:hypothetical protein
MSNQDVVLALDAMERMLQEGVLTASTLKPWQEQFDAAMASAERGQSWAEITERCHYLGRRVDLVLVGVLADREAIRKALHLMTVGKRALKGYKPPKS